MAAEEFATWRYIPAKDVAVTVRQRLKAEWPGVKFSVKTEHGTAVNIRWTDGPRSSVVDALLADLKGGYFDGMTDCYMTESDLYANPDGTVERVTSGAKYIFTRRDISDEWQEEVLQLFEKTTGVDIGRDKWGMWNVLVPLAVDRSTGKLLHMVETETEQVSTVFWQYTSARARGITCAHKPARLHAWTAYDGTTCIACNDCGEVLLGGC